MRNKNCYSHNFLNDSFDEKKIVFISRAGIEFNIDDVEWVVDSTNNTLYPERLRSLNLTNKEGCDVRLAFAYLATTRPVGSLTKFISGVYTSKIESLDSNGVESLSDDISSSSVDSLKALARQLVLIDTIYNEFLEAISKYKTPVYDNYSAVYDVELGSLSEFEFSDLAEKVNSYSAKLYGGCNRKNNRFSTDFALWERLLISRFMILFVRRPSQLSQLKWCDLSLVKNELGNEMELTMPMAKQKDDFREVFEIYPHKLLHKLTLELFKYREQYSKNLKAILELNNIEDLDIEKAMHYMPLFPNRKIFSCKIIDEGKLLSAFNNKSSGYHLKSVDIQNRFKALMEQISPVSDRLSAENYRIGNNRLRHTAGTSLAIRGYSEIDIAQALGNTPYAARFYVDLSDEVRISIDDAFESQTLLSKSFSGLLTHEILPSEVGVEDPFYGELGKSISTSTCERCINARPIGCYGCEMFRPLITADHESKLVEVKTLHKNRKESGNSDIALAGIRRIILKIEATIVACAQAKLMLRNVEAK